MPRKTSDSKKPPCFVICPIGEQGEPIRRRADQLLKHVIRPAAAKCGFEAVRSDRVAKPGLITEQIITHLLDDPMVVADLAQQNPNVFYELAIRHMVRKPFVLLAEPGQKLPFDVGTLRAIYVDLKDPDSWRETHKQLIEQSRSAVDDPDGISNPISATLALKAVLTSTKKEPLAAAVRTLVAEVQSLRAEMQARSPLSVPSYSALLGSVRIASAEMPGLTGGIHIP